MTVFRYGLTERPPVPGALPKAGLLHAAESYGMAPDGSICWGFGDYNRKLTAEEIENYELVYIHSYEVESYE